MQLFRKNEKKLPLFADSRWAILPFLLLADCGYLAFLTAFLYSLRLAQRLSNCLRAFSYTLLAVPNGCPIVFQSHFQRLSAKTLQCHSFFSEEPFFG
jgi:hypothetical protein